MGQVIDLQPSESIRVAEPSSDAERLRLCAALLASIDELTAERLRCRERYLAILEEIRAKEREMRKVMAGPCTLTLSPTSAWMRRQRRQQAADETVRLLRAAGGRMKGTAVAAALGVDAHGLARLIDSDPRIRRLHLGPAGYLRLWLELVEVTRTST